MKIETRRVKRPREHIDSFHDGPVYSVSVNSTENEIGPEYTFNNAAAGWLFTEWSEVRIRTTLFYKSIIVVVYIFNSYTCHFIVSVSVGASVGACKRAVSVVLTPPVVLQGSLLSNHERALQKQVANHTMDIGLLVNTILGTNNTRLRSKY